MKKRKHETVLVVGSEQRADDLPKWLLDAIAEERVVNGLVRLMKPDQTWQLVGDAELCAYLMTASLRAPMPSDYVGIYEWCLASLMERQGKELAEFLKEKRDRGLTKQEAFELDDLKHKIYSARGGEIQHPLLNALRDWKHDLDKLAAREAEVAKTQPSLFAEVGDA